MQTQTSHTCDFYKHANILITAISFSFNNRKKVFFWILYNFNYIKFCPWFSTTRQKYNIANNKTEKLHTLTTKTDKTSTQLIKQKTQTQKKSDPITHSQAHNHIHTHKHNSTGRHVIVFNMQQNAFSNCNILTIWNLHDHIITKYEYWF